MLNIIFSLGKRLGWDLQQSDYDLAEVFMYISLKLLLLTIVLDHVLDWMDLQKSQCSSFCLEHWRPSLEGPLGRGKKSRVQQMVSGVGKPTTNTVFVTFTQIEQIDQSIRKFILKNLSDSLRLA